MTGDDPVDADPGGDIALTPEAPPVFAGRRGRLRSHRRRRRWPVVVAAVLVAGLAVVGAGALWLHRQFNPPGPVGSEVDLTLAKGSSTARLAALLDERGVVDDARLFRLYVRLKHAGPFQAGQYTFRRREDFGAIVATLGRGPRIAYSRLTIPEGYTLEQIAAKVGRLPGRSAARFTQLARGGTVRSAYQPEGSNNLEGLLFPDTYLFEKKDDELAILRRMVDAFDQAVVSSGLETAAATRGMTPYELAIVASLVEREARVADDRGMVAQVIYNRLQKNMLLQVDATVLYALGSHKTRVLYKDLEISSPYNTYKVKGLPPTPIASPGEAALQAAAQPTTGQWLYYVVVEANGRHAFATTAAEHQRNIELARRRGLR